jgi:hypothetical protein
MPARDAKGRFVTEGGGGVKIHWHNPITDNLTRAIAFVEPYVFAVLEHDSGVSQNDLRQSAPWTDRTANARGGLFAQAYKGEGGEMGEVLYHTMPYGVYLELANGGKYRVIWPATLRAGRRVMTGIRMLMRNTP